MYNIAVDKEDINDWDFAFGMKEMFKFMLKMLTLMFIW